MRQFCVLLFAFISIQSFAQKKKLSDDQLLELVQKQTFKYFWDFAHPISGLARERSNETFGYGKEVVTTGGSGFGLMAIVVASGCFGSSVAMRPLWRIRSACVLFFAGITHPPKVPASATAPHLINSRRDELWFIFRNPFNSRDATSCEVRA